LSAGPPDQAPPLSVSTEMGVLGPKTKTVDTLLAESIDEVLQDLIGNKAKEAVFDYLERNYSLAREDIPSNVGRFLLVSEETFGKGTKAISRCIAKRLWEKLGWKFETISGLELPDYLEVAKVRIARELVKKAKASMLGRET
jgi:hypothetical protein